MDVAGFTYYKNIMCVSSNYLTGNGYLTDTYIRILKHRNQISVIKRGSKVSSALISFNSLPEKIKRQVIESKDLHGRRPEEIIKKEKEKCSLLMLLEEKENKGDFLSIEDWVDSYKVGDKYIENEKRDVIKNNIKIVESIMSLYNKTLMLNKAGGRHMSKKKFWDNIAKDVATEVTEEYPNNLPMSNRKLYQKVKDYQEFGKGIFIHKSYGNSNAQRLTEEQRATIVALISRGNRYTDEQVRRIAKHIGIDITQRRIQQIRKEENLYVTAGRDGVRAFYNTKARQQDRERPDMPLKYISLDGWDVELYYQNEDSYWNRLSVVVILDAMNDYPLGYAIGEHENANLTVEALKSAVHHTREVLGDYHGFWQIQSDNYARKILPKYYNSICKYYTPAAVGNAKSKVVERYWQYLKNEYFFIFNNYSHSNITSKDQPNSEFLNTMKLNFPSKEECINIISQVIEIDRRAKVQQLQKAWINGDDKFKLEFDTERYLLQFGDKGNGNMLTANGIKLIREGKEYKFECDDISIREHSDKRWVLHYDLRNMSKVVAESEDGKYRYMLSAKEKVPMALCDYTQEDYAKLERYREFNKQLIAQVEEKVSIRQQLAKDYMSKAEIEGDFAARLLTDKNGQHKDNKYIERQQNLLAEKENKVEKERDILACL